MQALIKRNLLIYFKNRSGVIFSVLGALISFILYLVFLKETMFSQWSQLDGSSQALDYWLIGGTLAVTAMTSTLSGLAQMVEDRERNVLKDITIGGLTETQINLSYISSGAIIGTSMQIVLMIVMSAYFMIVDKIIFPFAQLPALLATMIASSYCMSLFFFLVVKVIKRKNSLSKLETVIGTAAGFLACVYTPIGILPTFSQAFIKATPGIYLASIYRRLLMSDSIEKTSVNLSKDQLEAYKEYLGVGVKWQVLTTYLEEFAILIVIGVVGITVLAGIAMKRHYQFRFRM